MESGSRRALVLVVAILLAATVLGYFALEAALQFAEISEQSVLRSTLLLVDEKIARVERLVIDADEQVFRLIDPADPQPGVERTWPTLAPRMSPSVRALLVLDEDDNVRAYHCRCSTEQSDAFLRTFLGQILADLPLADAPLGQLGHLHRTYGGQSYLIAFRTVREGGETYRLLLHHDTGFLLREVFPTLLDEGAADRDFVVVDEEGRRIFGTTPPGGYVVGRSFDTTLYGWRLQLEPQGAAVLRARDESFFSAETALVTFALSVLLLGLGFLVYGTVQERRVAMLRSEFIANVSHELKTPLSVVRMFSEMLLTDRVRDPERRRQYLETILRESERLSALIENVLDFSAIERGKEAYQLRDGALGEVVQRAVDTVRHRAEQVHCELDVTIEPDLPTVRVDEQAILLVALNLLDNALKYGTPRADGPARVEVRVERGRRHLYVRVRDHGPGIPAEHHKRVFERFFRVPRVTGEQVRGSGIGLALVKRIVEAHGGKAWAENAEGGGAQVSFSLPFAAG